MPIVNPFLQTEQANPPPAKTGITNPFLQPQAVDPNVNPVARQAMGGQPQDPLQSWSRVDSKVSGIPTGAGFSTQWEASWPHDPVAKIGIYAKARGISPDRYGITDSGDIYFTAPDGQRYLETAPGVGKIQKLAAEVTGGESLPIIGGMIGSLTTGGFAPIAAAGFATLGEGMRQAKAAEGGETLPPEDRAAYLGAAGLSEATGSMIGAMAPKVVNRLMLMGNKNRLGRAMTDIEKVQAVTNRPETLRAMQLGEQMGIPLRPAQASRSGSLLAQEGIVRGQPEFEDRFIASQVAQEQGTNREWDRLMSQISQISDRETAGNRLVEASKGWWSRADQARTSATAPLFQAAFSTAPAIDTGPVIQLLDQKIKGSTLGSERRRLLERVKLGLMEEVTDPEGKTVRVPRTDLSGLHEWKMNLDKWNETPPDFLPHGLDKFMKKDMGEVKSAFFDIADTASPEYAAARERFAALSPPIDRFEKSQAGRLGRLEGDSVVTAQNQLFQSVMSRPETVTKYRQWIGRQDPEAWNAGVRTYLEGIFDDVKRNAGQESFNMPKALHDRVFGTAKQRDILAAAMTPQQFRTMEDFMFVLDRAAAGWNTGSQTMPRQVAMEKMKRDAVPDIASVPAKAWQTVTGVALNPETMLENLLVPGYQRRLAEALLDPRMAASVANIRRLKPGSEMMTRKTVELLADVGAGKFRRDVEQSTYPAMQEQ